jgi:hypothetical protein
MSFVGNREGPKKSEIVQKLGPDYFGISMEELEVEIQLYLDDEFNGIVDPVYVDKEGRHLLNSMLQMVASRDFILKRMVITLKVTLMKFKWRMIN